MTAGTGVPLAHGDVSARVLPEAGGVLLDLLVEERPVLVSTPWASAVPPRVGPAITETEWVGNWRGGWQLCFPTAGQTNPAATVPESFHGAASQAPWREVSRSVDGVVLGWTDARGLSVERSWRLIDDGVRSSTRVRNADPRARTLVIAEHLVFGGDVLSEPLELDVPAGTRLRPLDYAGLTVGEPSPWPGRHTDRWTTVDRTTPARVTGLLALEPRRIGAHGAHVVVSVEWEGSALPHALLWEELAASHESPWDGRVVALGIEPTSTPHGAGTALDDALIRLPPGGVLEWSVALHVHWASPPRSSTPRPLARSTEEP